MKFKLESPFSLSSEQLQAVESLYAGLVSGQKSQVLLGVTGSGKTFSMANLIAKTGRPALILAHNKTLAAQLYQEFKSLFPSHAIEYFVSYYDYYQPEAYMPRTDTFIEKDLSKNDQIDRLRLRATCSLLERRDVIIVASVSCIYGLGSPTYFKQMRLTLKVGEHRSRDDLLLDLVQMQYERAEHDLTRATFRVRGDLVEILPAYEDDRALRVEFFGDEVERLREIDPLTGRSQRELNQVSIYPRSHHVTPEQVRLQAIETIRDELAERIAYFEQEGRLLERQRLEERTRYDMEMLKEVGYCKGVENYSRHFDNRPPNSPPFCLLDYFPDDYLLFIDESHQTIPQIKAMYQGDRGRKNALVSFGFRLPSAYDNRPLSFEEFSQRYHQVIFVSATPGRYELEEAQGIVVEQIIRPTGLLDPHIEVRPAHTQVDDVLEAIGIETAKGGRTLVTTLTKKLAEDLTSYLNEIGLKAKYLHSEIDTLERITIIQDLRKGTFDVLVGVNLLREGLDLPEVSLVAILDGDRQGFLRSHTALIQTCGRAARNQEGHVIIYADQQTEAIQQTLDVTHRRRALQEQHNFKHGITPQTIQKDRDNLLTDISFFTPKQSEPTPPTQDEILDLQTVQSKITEHRQAMLKAAQAYRFEEAARERDSLHHYQSLALLEDGSAGD